MRYLILAFCLLVAAPVAAQSLLERLQGLYYPDLPGTSWDCRTVGGDGGALAIRGNALIGVENTCQLTTPSPIPGMDAIRFGRSCSGEGTTYDAGPIIVMPSDAGVILLSEGFATEWLRCP